MSEAAAVLGVRPADFEGLEQAEGRIWSGKGTAGEKKSQLAGSKSGG